MTIELRCRRRGVPVISAVFGSGGCRTHPSLAYECLRLGVQQEGLGPSAYHPLPHNLACVVDGERAGMD